MKSIFEQTGGTYFEQDDYFLPNLSVLENKDERHIGVWGQRRKQYLKQHHRILYYNLLTSCKLHEHLSDVEEHAEELFSQLVKDLAEKENVTEKLKAENQMLWAQRMNNIRQRATEIVSNELLYS